MIQVTYQKENNYFKRIIIKGHAGYAQYGYDIVCSSVSSIITTSINGILSLDENALEVTDNGQEMIIKVLKKDEITTKLLENMFMLFEELEKQYPKNITIRKEKNQC